MARSLLLVLALSAALLAPPASAAAAGRAPGAPGDKQAWTPADKQGLGTAVTERSTVWHTLGQGVLTEVYYPRLDTPSVRDLELIVTDGRSFTDRERADTVHDVELVDPRSLTYRQVNTARSGRYRITRTYTADPHRPVVLIDVGFTSLDGGDYQVFARYDPALGNDGDDDTARTAADAALVATDDELASAFVAAPGFGRIANGYAGTSDGWVDLRDDHRMDWPTATRRTATSCRPPSCA